MHRCTIVHQEMVFGSVEAAFMANKCIPRMSEFTSLTPWEARKLGRAVQLRSDWPEVKVAIMTSLLRLKFEKGSYLGDMLADTGDKEMIESATWDRFWGDGGNGKGQNIMGKLLMQVRKEITMK